MKAVVYHGPGRHSWETVPDPVITDDRDAIVRVDAVAICGTDLHILKGESCGSCRFCRVGAYGQCIGDGGWILGHTIDGVQAELARVRPRGTHHA